MGEEEINKEKVNKDFLDFSSSVRRLKESRIYKVRNSYGVYDGFKYYRKIRPKEHKYALNESQYFAITRKINTILGEALINGEDILLPYRLGRLEIRKFNASITFDGDKIKTNLPIDWDRTLRLWYEDKESFKNKALIRIKEKEIYRTHYNRTLAEYKNKSFYTFYLNRALKRRMKQNIKEGKLDAFPLK